MTERIYVEEAGCNRRKLDLGTIRRYLEMNGYLLVDRPEKADRILVSTCAFKKKEEDESVRRLRTLRRYGKELLVLGCLPDIAAERYREFGDIPKVAPKEIEKIDGYFGEIKVPFNEVAQSHTLGGNANGLVSALKRKLETGIVLDREFWEKIRVAGVKRLREMMVKPEETYFLFICRGCRGKCSYCGIRNSIGQVISKTPEEVLAELMEGVEKGYRNFSILGDDPGCYGLDRQTTLADLLEVLLAAPSVRPSTPSDAGIRFHIREIHPKFLISYVDRMLGIEGFGRFRSILCPIQSGSDRILDLMEREHTERDLREAIVKIRSRHPEIVLDTQMIVGFPTETQEDFRATLASVRNTGFNSVVVFPYDDKTGSASAEIPEKVPAKVIQGRMKEAFRYFDREGISAYYSCP